MENSDSVFTLLVKCYTCSSAAESVAVSSTVSIDWERSRGVCCSVEKERWSSEGHVSGLPALGGAPASCLCRSEGPT